MDSQNNVANFYLRGDGVEINYQKAKYWYLKAAEQGSDYAQYELAVMYILGEGVEKNKQKAKDLLIKSAAQKNKSAEKALVAIGLEDNAEKFSKKRMSDVYAIASLLEEFKKITGHYPFYTQNEPVQEGYKKIGTLVTIGTSTAEEQLSKEPNPFHISSTKAYSSHLKRELEQKLERKIELPTDPQEVPIYAPNAYYVYFPAEDDEYLVMAFLYNPNAFTYELFNAHANVYVIASSPVISEYRFWNSAGIKPRIFKYIKQ
nr:tetratricopeptide repeat protein [uncultured Desulfuromonas sp.]